jgi:aspartyl protease family protein
MRRTPWTIAALLFTSLARAQYLDLDPNVEFKEVYARLGVEIPEKAARDPSAWLRLEELKREPCDQRSVRQLADSLDNRGYRRVAADALFNFVKDCGAPTSALHKSIDLLLRLSAYDRAVVVADYFVRVAPNDTNARYLRGLAMVGLGANGYAIADFANAIELYDSDRKTINSNVFFKMAEAYAAEKRFCEASTPIEMWVRLDPLSRDTPRTQKIIGDYEEKGQCRATEKPVVERFPMRGGARTVQVTAEINGVKGRFLLDTGASYLSLSSAFAKKSHVERPERADIKLQTANGPSMGVLTKVDRVKLGRLESKSVPAVIHVREDALGPAIDGLLGVSFLSRFDIQIVSGNFELRNRGAAAAQATPSPKRK